MTVVLHEVTGVHDSEHLVSRAHAKPNTTSVGVDHVAGCATDLVVSEPVCCLGRVEPARPRVTAASSDKDCPYTCMFGPESKPCNRPCARGKGHAGAHACSDHIY
jgi:hypothetical protein